MVNWWCFNWTSKNPENNVVFYPLPMTKKDRLHFHILAGGNDMAILCYFLLLTRPNPYCSKSNICKVLYGMTTRTKRDFKSKFGYQAKNLTWYYLYLKVVSAVMSPVWKSVLHKDGFSHKPFLQSAAVVDVECQIESQSLAKSSTNVCQKPDDCFL